MRALLIVSLAGALAACGSAEPFRVVQIQLGRSLNADNTVAQPAVSFHPHDSIFLSVMTSGRGSATLSVRWTYAGRVIAEPKQQIHYTYADTAAAQFRLENAEGFPPGEYTVDVFLDGKPAGTKTFRVGD